MTDDGLLPRAMATRATRVATAILQRLCDRDLVAEATSSAERVMGHAIWDPRSLYSGDAGSALAFGYAARACPDSREDWWTQARDCLRRATISTRLHPVAGYGMSSGSTGIALAVAGCDPDGRYTRTLHGLHARIAEQVDHLSDHTDRGPSFCEYDVISGPAGALGHLIRHADDAAQRASTVLVERLVALCNTAGPQEPDGDSTALEGAQPGNGARDAADWAPWRIPRQNDPQRQEEHELYPYGYVDLGLAHGIVGPLVALSRAWLAGPCAPGLRTAIRTLTGQLVAVSEEDGVDRYWPRVLPYDASGEVAPDTGRPSLPAYCYGAPGITAALLDAADALGDETVRDVAVQGFETALRQLLVRPAWPSPGICHGTAGQVLICYKFATQTGSKLSRIALVGMVDQLPGHCRAHLPFFVQDHKPPEAGAPGSPLARGSDGARIDSPGLLEGATGVALTLLSAGTSAPPDWARAFLVT